MRSSPDGPPSPTRQPETDGRPPGDPVLDRRRFLSACSAAGVGGTLMPGVLWSRIQEEEAVEISTEMVADAEVVAGLELTSEERQQLVEGVNDYLEGYRAIRDLEIPNEVPPAVDFDPVMPGIEDAPEADERPLRVSPQPSARVPEDLEELAYEPVTRLAELIRTRRLKSEDLTRMYLERLRRLDPTLHCVITFTEGLALKQARRADREIANGTYRGPLHGIPWVAKDLLATRSYPTTWGAMPYRDQVIHEDSTVVERLDAAGAVLIAKSTLGALAWGDVWFGGKTRNPWNLEQGSSGSSAGSAAAVAAGGAGFGIGTETLGSIVSPCTRCGCTGLRPTFGRVSRYGAMALSWSMDKIGPICRSAEDCALVFDAIHGADGLDPAARSRPFTWDPYSDPRRLRVGYFESAFEREDPEYFNREQDQETLRVLREIGFDLVEFEMPEFPAGALRIILDVEAAAAFDALTRGGRDELMVRQVENAWPNAFREARFVPAVEYVQANRARTMLMRRVDEAMRDIDVFVTPSFGGGVLMTTNLTGHPCAVVPNGFVEPREGDGDEEPDSGQQGGSEQPGGAAAGGGAGSAGASEAAGASRGPGSGTGPGTGERPSPRGRPLQPVSVSFIGGLYRDDATLAVAHAYQQATGFHERHPDLSDVASTPPHPPDADYLDGEQ